MPPKDRSVGAALVLTFFLGPLGLLYVTVPGGIALTLGALVAGAAALGLILPLFWIASMIWAGIAASNLHSRYQAWFLGQVIRPTQQPNAWPPSIPPPPPGSVPPPPPPELPR